MRLFTAVALPPAIVDSVGLVQRRLATSLGHVKWVEAANLHLTLRFIGEVEPAVGERVADALGGLPRRLPFRVEIGGAGAFPERGGPRIVWLGVSRGASELVHLVADIETALQLVGLPAEDRPFSAHLTLGRMRVPGRPRDRRTIGQMATERLGEFTCERFSLYRSRLSSSGAVHEIVREYAL